MQKSVDFEIIVPVKNEAGNISELLRRIDKSFSNSGVRYNVIFVDDNSTDGTRRQIEKSTSK